MASIYEYVKEQRDRYRSDTIQIADGYDYSQYETLRTIELYDNSRFLTGNKDTLDREKPFYNVGKFRRNVATRATDLDTKDVIVESERIGANAFAASFLLNLKNRNWMKQSGFAKFLNEMGQTRAKYGGVLVKKIEQKDELRLHVMAWRDMVTDQIDIRSGVKIFRDYYTPADLKEMASSGWKNIDEAIATAKKRKEATPNSGQENKTPGAYIEVYFVDGVLPTCFLAGTSEKYAADYGSEEEYERQSHIVVLDESDKKQTRGVTLFGGISDEDPYKYLEWEKVPGRGLGVGVIEDLFEAQVWTNYTAKQKKDMLDLAGKIIFQTTDSSIAARNVLTDMENGDIITTKANASIEQVSNVPASFQAFEKLAENWDLQAERVSSTYGAITGETMPAGTPFRQVAILNQEAGSLFEYRREEAGQFIQEIYYDWILPFLVKQLKEDKELTATLEPEELELVSEALANAEALKFAKEQALGGNLVQQQDIDAIKGAVRDSSMKMRRKGFKEFANLFDDWQGIVDVVTTGEQKNKAAVLETLFNIFKVVAQAPQLLQDPVLRRLFNQLMETAGISPLLLQSAGAPTAQQQTNAALPDKINKTAAA